MGFGLWLSITRTALGALGLLVLSLGTTGCSAEDVAPDYRYASRLRSTRLRGLRLAPALLR